MTVHDVRTPVAAAAATVLGALALSPVLSSAAWVRPVVGAVLVVLLTGLALRAAGTAVTVRAFPDRPVPAAAAVLGTVLVPAGQLAALTVYATRQATDVGGFLPTPAGVEALLAVLRDGAGEIQEQVAPAAPVASLTALIVVFVGLVAVVVYLLAVAARAGAVAGLVLLVLFGVPVFTLTGDIGLLPVIAPAAGLALLLWADQAGRLEAGSRVGGARSAGGGTAARIAAVAVLAGVLVGGVLPTLAEGTISGGTGTGGTGGSGGTGTGLDPVASMYGELTRNDPIDLLRMQTSVDDPGYLRAVTVDRYDVEDGWTLGEQADPGLPVDERLPSQPESFGREVTASIAAVGHDDRFLPVPTSPVTVRVEGRDDGWVFDPVTNTVAGTDVTTENRSYEVTAAEVRPTPEQLQEVQPLGQYNPLQQRFTALPADLDPRVRAQVAGLVDGLAPEDGYERVRRILDFLTDARNGFTYSLSTPRGTSGDDLVDFLLERRGYCEQYAGAMAVMVRAAGLPARVALGYTPGTVEDGGTRLITSNDAHAWVEVFFNGRGWVPFDPTPIDPGRRAELPWAPRVAPVEAPAQAAPDLEIPSDLYLLGDPGNPLVQGPGATDGPLPGASTADEGGFRPGPAALVLLALLALGAAALPAGVRLLQRRRRLADGSAQALWDELTATADDLGLERDPAWTPREAGRALADRALGAPGAGAIGRLARAEELASYGPAGSGREDGLDGALRTARRELLGSVDRPTRLRAAFWPASLPATVRAGLPDRARGWAEMRRSRRPGGRRLRAGDAGS
jgi:transglutaminase-like putative cysteine protease